MIPRLPPSPENNPSVEPGTIYEEALIKRFQAIERDIRACLCTLISIGLSKNDPEITRLTDEIREMERHQQICNYPPEGADRLRMLKSALSLAAGLDSPLSDTLKNLCERRAKFRKLIRQSPLFAEKYHQN